MIKLCDKGINGILASEMGLGKPLQTISLLGYLHECRGINRPHMVVSLKSRLGTGLNEIKCLCPVLCKNNLNELWELLIFFVLEILCCAETSNLVTHVSRR